VAEKRLDVLESRHRRDSSIDRSRVGADAAAAEGGAGVVAAGKRGEKLDSRRWHRQERSQEPRRLKREELESDVISERRKHTSKRNASQTKPTGPQ